MKRNAGAILALFLFASLVPGCGPNDGSDNIRSQISGLFAIDTNFSTVVATPPTAAADGADTIEVSITLVDSQGSPLQGLEVFIDVSGRGNVVIQPASLTDSRGQARALIRSTVAEPKIVTTTVFDFVIQRSINLDTITVDFQ